MGNGKAKLLLIKPSIEKLNGRFEVLTVVIMKVGVYWEVIHSVVDNYQHLEKPDTSIFKVEE
jgi:hypothetical protein